MADGYSDQFNTKLSPTDEADFWKWLNTVSQTMGRDKSKDMADYDLRGLWKVMGDQYQFSPHQGLHTTDVFKKPNHPTFSNQSEWHGIGGLEGGDWGSGYGDSGPNNFMPGATNPAPVTLAEYFKRYEPDYLLNDLRKR